MILKNNKVTIIVLLSIFIISFSYRIIFYDYGLPYFTNSDEGSLIKSTLFFFNLFSSASPSQLSSEPIYGALLNFLFSGFILFLKQLFVLDFNFSLIPNKIYFDPSIFTKIGRLSSILANSLTVGIFSYIILKFKLKLIDKILIILLFCFSYSQIEISQVYGKNSYAVLFFLLQILLIFKLVEKELLTKKDIILLSLTSAIAFGINYISALPTLLFLFSRFLNKEIRAKEIKKYFFFSINFFILIIPVIILNDYPFYKHFFNLEGRELLSPEKNKFQVIIKNFKEYLLLIVNFEIPLLLIYLASINQFIKNKFKNDYKFIFLLLLSFLIILIFCLADYSKPSVRYFALIAPAIYILVGFLGEYLDTKKLIFFRVIIFLLISFNFIISTTVILKSNNKQTQYLALDYMNAVGVSTKNIVIHFNELGMRESIYHLNTNKELLKKKIIQVSKIARGKNTLDKIEIKIEKLNKYSDLSNFKYEGFVMTNGIDILNHEKFFKKLKSLNYTYYIVDNHRLLRTKKKVTVIDYLNKNYELIKSIEGNKILYRRNINNLKEIFELKRFGPDILIYKL